MMKKILIYITLILFTISCKKVVEIENKEVNKKLVIQSLFNQDSTWRVFVSESVSKLNNEEFINVSEADISIHDKDGILIENLTHTKNGIFKSTSNKPISGESYEIRGHSAKYPEVITAKSNLPSPVDFTIDTLGIYRDQSEKVQLTFTINDNPDEDNYYIIRVHEISDYNNGGEIWTNDHWVTSNDVNLENTKLEDFENEGFSGAYMFLRDDNFNGKTYKLKCEMYRHNLYNTVDYTEEEYTGNENTKIYFVVSNCTEDAFYYMLSGRHIHDSYNEPLITPMNMHSNFSHRIGIFAGHYDSKIQFFNEE